MPTTPPPQGDTPPHGNETRFAADPARTRCPHDLHAGLPGETDPHAALALQGDDGEAVYGQILDAAITLMGADCASLQILDPERGSGGALRPAAHRGLSPEAAAFWEWVEPRRAAPAAWPWIRANP